MAKDYKPYSLGSKARETETMKPTDKACIGQVSKPAGCNASEPTDSLVTLNNGGRALGLRAKTTSMTGKVVKHRQGHHRGDRDDTLVKREWETWETLPCQHSFDWGRKTESYKAEPKGTRDREGVGVAHSSEEYRGNITRSPLS